MRVLARLLHDPTWLAHLVGLGTIAANTVADGNPLVSGIVAAVTAVFHVCQTFGNGTAVPPGWGPRPDTTLPTPDGTPKVDAPAPQVHNASGTAPLDL